MLPTNFGHTISRMGDVFDGYRRGPAWDEMIDETGSARAPYRVLFDSIRNAGTQELRSGADALARSYLNQGVTFDVGGEERPFPLDIVPRVIDDATWQIIETGVRQRVKALEALLADVYGPARAVQDGVVPRRRHHLLEALPSAGVRHRAAERGARTHRRDRSHPRRVRARSGCSRTTCASRPA